MFAAYCAPCYGFFHEPIILLVLRAERWSMMKAVVRQVVFFVSISLCLFCWMGVSLRAQPSGQKPGPSEISDASKLFKDNCAKCHGKDGRAKGLHGRLVGARNLTNAKWQASVQDEQIIAAIKKGPGAMPSFERKFSQAQIESLVTYVRHFKQEDAKSNKK
jgi:mono/diheme cytochrome c family protein